MAKSIEFYFIAKKYKFLIDKPPDPKEVGQAMYDDWLEEDAYIHILLWNNM